MKMMKNVLATILLGLFGTLTVAAQTPQPMPQQQTDIEVSDEELESFIQVVNQIQKINQESQTEMISAIEETGITVERFSEINQAEQNPQVEVEVGESEQAQYSEAMAVVQEI